MSLRQKIEDSCFNLYRIVGRLIIKHSNNPRPASTPYISGDGFRSIAQHVFDRTSRTLSGVEVKEGDIVFVGDSLIEQFIEKVHPHITCQYTLITHIGDAKITKALFDQVESKLIKWYGINLEYTHPKIVPIPLGIENKHYYVNGITAIFNYVRKKHPEKKNKIFYGFTVAANPAERGAALKNIQANSNGETLMLWRGFFFYLLILNTYKLVLSPPGSSEEGHRTWDTMYIGSVPIVKSSYTTEYFKKNGVPLITVQDWSELQKFGAAFIQAEYEKTVVSGNQATLALDYWVQKIKNCES
jgi:hypothetical protein